jgi:hypothetical protein
MVESVHQNVLKPTEIVRNSGEDAAQTPQELSGIGLSYQKSTTPATAPDTLNPAHGGRGRR